MIEAAVERTGATRMLVTTGAADADGVGARDRRVAAAADAARTSRSGSSWARGARADVPRRRRRRCTRPTGSRPSSRPRGIVVTAGGVALLEACLLGRPIVALALAGNQRQAVCGLEREGAVVVATPETAADVVARWSTTEHAGSLSATAARAAVDGKGAARVVDS